MSSKALRYILDKVVDSLVYVIVSLLLLLGFKYFISLSTLSFTNLLLSIIVILVIALGITAIIRHYLNKKEQLSSPLESPLPKITPNLKELTLELETTSDWATVLFGTLKQQGSIGIQSIEGQLDKTDAKLGYFHVNKEHSPNHVTRLIIAGNFSLTNAKPMFKLQKGVIGYANLRVYDRVLQKDVGYLENRLQNSAKNEMEVPLYLSDFEIPGSKMLTEYKTKGTLEAYTREEIQNLRPLEKFLKEATQSVAIVGVSLIVAGRTRTASIKPSLRAGRRVIMLMLNPESNLVSRYSNELNWVGLKGDIQQALITLCSIKNGLDDEPLNKNQRDKLEIRTYDCIPVLSMIVLDEETENPTLQIGTYARGTDPSSRIAVVIRKSENEALVLKYLEEYKRFYNSSKAFACPDLSSPRVNSRKI